MALRRIYSSSWRVTIAKGLAIGIIYYLLLIAVVLAVVMYTVVNL